MGSRFICINHVTLHDGGENRKVLIYMYKSKCDLCASPVHKNCTLFVKIEHHNFVRSRHQDWTCQNCVESIFPFNHFTDDDVFHGCLIDSSYDCYPLDPYLQPKIFDPYNFNDEKDYIPCSVIDPDSCYYNELSYFTQTNSNNYHEDSCNHSFAKTLKAVEALSLMHLNIRGIQNNLSKLIK